MAKLNQAIDWLKESKKVTRDGIKGYLTLLGRDILLWSQNRFVRIYALNIEDIEADNWMLK